jgi:glutamine synthetase
MIKKVAERHVFVALLHEKPYDGVNGSGKHNNWSLSTDRGDNLLSPGDTPHDNAQFLLFLCAVIKAVDEYQDLLRISVASAGNDHRLGASEAPPAVVSIFLGDELTAVLESIEKDIPYENSGEVLMKLGTEVLPGFRRDNTDRNRTSPFAFTGNKFEFRMPGAMSSLAFPNVILNSAVADALSYYADRLEDVTELSETVYSLIRETVRDHKRIIFNGNGYEQEWITEAERRGLSNYRTTPDCIPHLLDEKNVNMLTSLKVFSRSELESRCEIILENYCKTIIIEARTMRSMAVKRIAPAVEAYTAELSANMNEKKRALPDLECRFEKEIITKLSDKTDLIYSDVQSMIAVLNNLSGENYFADSEIIRDELIPAMRKLREDGDAAEMLTSKKYWPLPNYGLLMFGEK